jgi:hypothetical protein
MQKRDKEQGSMGSGATASQMTPALPHEAGRPKTLSHYDPLQSRVIGRPEEGDTTELLERSRYANILWGPSAGEGEQKEAM